MKSKSLTAVPVLADAQVVQETADMRPVPPLIGEARESTETDRPATDHRALERGSGSNSRGGSQNLSRTEGNLLKLLVVRTVKFDQRTGSRESVSKKEGILLIEKKQERHKMKIQIPKILQSDLEKSIAFRAGYGDESVSEQWQQIMRVYRLDENEFLLSREDLLAPLSLRAKKIANAWAWGLRLRWPNPPFHPAPVEHERTGTMDAYEYMMQRRAGRYMPHHSWPSD